MTLNKDPVPLQWALPPALELPPDKLKLQLSFYEDAIMMHVVEGNTIVTKLVAADDIARALASGLHFSSGLLPQDVLWWSSGRDGPVVALWRSPRVWKVALQQEAFAPARRFSLPMPGLVFLCRPALAPSVFAVKMRPASPEVKVYRAPCFNVFQDGRVCPGTHRFPAQLQEIPESFFLSHFSPTGDTLERSLVFPKDLLARWETLDGKRRYPLDDLVHQCTIATLMERG